MVLVASTTGKPLSYCDLCSGSWYGENPCSGGQEGAGHWRSPGAEKVDRACAPTQLGALGVADRSRNAVSLGSLLPSLTTTGPHDCNYQLVHSWEGLLIVESSRQLQPLSVTFHLPVAGLLAPRAAWPPGLECPFSLSSQGQESGQSPGRTPVWHEGSSGLLDENSLPRMKFLLGHCSAQL